MSKPLKQTTAFISQPERAVFLTCIIAISLAFVFIRVYFTYSWLFFIILLIDLAVVLNIVKLAETGKRFVLFTSIAAALFAVIFLAIAYNN